MCAMLCTMTVCRESVIVSGRFVSCVYDGDGEYQRECVWRHCRCSLLCVTGLDAGDECVCPVWVEYELFAVITHDGRTTNSGNAFVIKLVWSSVSSVV